MPFSYLISLLANLNVRSEPGKAPTIFGLNENPDGVVDPQVSTMAFRANRDPHDDSLNPMTGNVGVFSFPRSVDRTIHTNISQPPSQLGNALGVNELHETPPGRESESSLGFLP
jgi:hypothetical protein